MSDQTTINETCACGATFEYKGDSPSRHSSEWREGHRHEMPATNPTPPAAAEVHAVTGTHHQAGVVRSGPVGRKAVGFQHVQPSTTEKENHHG